MKPPDISEQISDSINLSGISGNMDNLEEIEHNRLQNQTNLSEFQFYYLLAWLTLKKSFNISKPPDQQHHLGTCQNYRL